MRSSFSISVRGATAIGMALLLLCNLSYARSDDRIGPNTPGHYNTLDPDQVHWLAALNKQLREGTISIEDYRRSLDAISHGVHPTDTTPPDTHTIVPPRAPAPPVGGSESHACNNVSDCGSCFYNPASGWSGQGACVPGDPTQIGGCDFKACGAVPDGDACGTSQPGSSGYTWPCKSGTSCKGPSPAGNFVGICKPAPPASSPASTVDTSVPGSIGYSVGKYTYAGFEPSSIYRHLTETDPSVAAKDWVYRYLLNNAIDPNTNWAPAAAAALNAQFKTNVFQGTGKTLVYGDEYVHSDVPNGYGLVRGQYDSKAQGEFYWGYK